MRTIILACALALAACGKPAEDKKTEQRDPPPPTSVEAQPAPPPPTAPPPSGAPVTEEEKAKEAAKIEAKLLIVDEQALKLTEDMKKATTATERETLIGKLEHLQQEKLELRKQLATYKP